MTGSRSLAFSTSRPSSRRRNLRLVGVVLAVLVTVLLAWAAIVGGLWAYAWWRLGPTPFPALTEEVTALGVDGARAPASATTVLVVFTGPVDPTVLREPPLVAPVVLLQFGGPRTEPAALVLPADLPVTVEATGQQTLADLQLAGGEDRLVRAVTDYTQVRLDHVVSVSADALPRLVAAFGGELEVCDPTGRCRTTTPEQFEVALEQTDDVGRVQVVADVLRAAAARVDPAFVATAPLDAKRLVDVVADEVDTDVSLRGTTLLAVGRAVDEAGSLEIQALPMVANPATGEVLVLEEPAAVRFQHLRDGTPFTPGQDAEDEAALLDEVAVAVLNGAGVSGLASEVRTRLDAGGFRVVGTGNAPEFDRATSVVTYAEGDPAVAYVAVRLAEALGGASVEPIAARPTFEGEEVDVLVTVGLDQVR